jgi:DNA-binding NarL/FixJ family response regulator
VLLSARLQPDPEARATLAGFLDELPETHRWQRALVSEHLARLLLDTHPDEAHERLLFALAVGLEEGMLPLERRARQALRQLGREPMPSSLERRMRTLTVAELRVASRAASGLSNRDIARELFVTLKTVEFHLARTYRKLGVASRRELATAFAEAGEIAPPASA